MGMGMLTFVSGVATFDNEELQEQDGKWYVECPGELNDYLGILVYGDGSMTYTLVVVIKEKLFVDGNLSVATLTVLDTPVLDFNN